MVRMDFGDVVVGSDVKAVEVIVGVRNRRDVMVQLRYLIVEQVDSRFSLTAYLMADLLRGIIGTLNRRADALRFCA